MLPAYHGFVGKPLPDGGGGINYTDVLIHCAADSLALSDDDPVSSWTDLSGNGFHLTQATEANRPTYKVNTINGLPSIRFGTSKWFVLPSAAFSGLSGISALVVMKLDTDPPSTGGGLWNIQSSGENSHVPFTDGNIYEAFGRTVRSNVGNPATTLAQWNTYIVTVGGGTAVSYLNNSSIHSESRTYGVTASNALLGRNDFGHPHDGNIAEFVLFDKSISSTRRDYWYDLMVDKYSVP